MNNLDKLIKITKDYGVYDICRYILDNPKFEIWSGSHLPKQHHYGKGGLVRHILEVVELSIMFNKYYGNPVNEKHLILAAMFHDSGKIYDYEPVTGTDYKDWIKTKHARQIRHLPKSAIIWSKAVTETGLYKEVEDEITHAILSHHGIEGSPVAPDTKMAWFVHLADCMSARIDDCDTFDYIKNNQRNEIHRNEYTKRKV